MTMHFYPAIGVYTAIVTAGNSVNAMTAKTVVTVTDVPISGLAAENDGPTVLGEPTVLTATVVRGTNVAYAWAFGDGQVGEGSVVEHRYAAAGVYTATATASNSVGVQVARMEVTVEERSIFVIYLPLVLQRGE